MEEQQKSISLFVQETAGKAVGKKIIQKGKELTKWKHGRCF